MPNNKKQIKEGIFDAADRFVVKFFDGLKKGAADQIIKKAEKAKLPPEAIANMKRLEKSYEDFLKSIKDIK